MMKKEKIQIGENELSIETGSWAKQADGAVVYKCGSLVLIATVCAAKNSVEGQDFFPLTVDYREKSYASGAIPGGYFKREARPGEHEILLSRLIDRPCRPLFPKGYFCEVQLLITVLSFDKNIAIEGHAITAASAALSVSDIPWAGPIAAVLVNRVEGKLVTDAGIEERSNSDLELIVAGSKDVVLMIEGDASEINNEEMIAAIDFAHKAIQSKIDIQVALAKKVDIPKREIPLLLPEEELMKEVNDYSYDIMYKANATSIKAERDQKITDVYNQTLEYFKEKLSQKMLNTAPAPAPTPSRSLEKALEKNLQHIKNKLHEVEFHVVRDLLFKEKKRADGRAPDEIRNISVELDCLPNVHGSAVFTRGQTQSLSVVTLGTKTDRQRYDTLSGPKEKNFLLHYNFPPFSTGEVKRIPGPGRREIGHGNLAARAFKSILPERGEFPYVIRIVSEILESNGSSSMATVCASSLAMQVSGVPLKAPVSGIAMGLMTDDKGEAVVLSDIAGIEDHFGDMDFKVAGTEKGITAFQLDLKVEGVSLDILRKVLKQAEEGRLHILKKMNEHCAIPRADLPSHAPRIEIFHIDPSRVGELIGPGGKIIRSIIEKTGAEVNVEDDGEVSITSTSLEANNTARSMVENIFKDAKEGDAYEGIVKRIVNFGAFIEIFPGKEGLLHISKMSNERVASVEDVFSLGDNVPVVIASIDRTGRIDLRHKDVQVHAFGSDRSQNHERGGGGHSNNSSHSSQPQRNRSTNRSFASKSRTSFDRSKKKPSFSKDRSNKFNRK